MSGLDVMNGDYCKIEIIDDNLISFNSSDISLNGRDNAISIVCDILQEIIDGVFDRNTSARLLDRQAVNDNVEIRNPRAIHSYMKEVDNLIQNLHCMQEHGSVPLGKEINKYIEDIRSLENIIHVAETAEKAPYGQGDCAAELTDKTAAKDSEGALEHKKTSTNILKPSQSPVPMDALGESTDEEEIQVIELNDNEPLYFQAPKTTQLSEECFREVSLHTQETSDPQMAGGKGDRQRPSPDKAQPGIDPGDKKKKLGLGTRLMNFFTKIPKQAKHKPAQ